MIRIITYVVAFSAPAIAFGLEVIPHLTAIFHSHAAVLNP